MVIEETLHGEHTVLGNGFIRYVSHMGDDLMVVNAARVSFKKKSELENGEMSSKDVRLLSYLAEHGHWTPFSHPQVCLHVKAPIFVRAQFFKHKVGFTENEISRRYVTDDPEFYWPYWRKAPVDGAKQGSSDPFEQSEYNAFDRSMHDVVMAASAAYRSLIDKGVAPEQARAVLPQTTYTEWWWTGSLAAWARFYAQRIDPHAQWEARQYAEVIGSYMLHLFPQSWHALTKKVNQ